MKRIAFTGFEPMGSNRGNEVLKRIRTVQERVFTEQGFEYKYLEKGFITAFDLSNFLLDSDKTRRIGAASADIARLMWAKILLEKGYDEVFWIDADLVPLVNFNPNLELQELPAITRELRVSNIKPEENRALQPWHKRTVTMLQFGKEHIFAIDMLLGFMRSICVGQEYTWWMYGTELFSNLANLIKFPTIEGMGHVTRLTLGKVYNSESAIDFYLNYYNKWWKEFDSELNSLNIAYTNEGRAQEFLDRLKKRGLFNG